MSSLTLEDIDSVSEAGANPLAIGGGGGGVMPHHEKDTVGPLPRPVWPNTFSSNPYGPSYMPPPPLPPQNYAPTAPYLNDNGSYISVPGNGAESVHSGSGE